MNIVFLTSMREAATSPPLLHTLLTEAVEGSLVEWDIEVTGGMSTNADQGWQAMLAMASYIDIDSVICFDKTCASLGLEGMGFFVPEYMRLPDRLSLTNVMRLPSSLDPWWAWEDNTSIAVAHIKPMLIRAPVSAPRPHLAWPSTTWN